MPAENSFRRTLQAHLRATKAGRFGQFEYSWLNEPIDAIGGSIAAPIRPGRGSDYFMRIFIDDGSIDGRVWVPSDGTVPGVGIPDQNDYTSELSIAANPGVTPVRSAGRFSEFVDDQSRDFSSAGKGPFGATVTDPVSNVITLSELSAPPGNVDASVLGPVSVTFTVVPPFTQFPDPEIWRSIFTSGQTSFPVLIIEVFNNSATQNLEGFYFNGPAGFTYPVRFTPRETSAQNVPTAGEPGAEGFGRWVFNRPI